MPAVDGEGERAIGCGTTTPAAAAGETERDRGGRLECIFPLGDGLFFDRRPFFSILGSRPLWFMPIMPWVLSMGGLNGFFWVRSLAGFGVGTAGTGGALLRLVMLPTRDTLRGLLVAREPALDRECGYLLFMVSAYGSSGSSASPISSKLEASAKPMSGPEVCDEEWKDEDLEDLDPERSGGEFGEESIAAAMADDLFQRYSCRSWGLGSSQ